MGLTLPEVVGNLVESFSDNDWGRRDMAIKTGEYSIVGRYMSGAEVTGYHLVSNMTGQGSRFSREQVILLVGRGQVSNCNASLSGDKVVLSGIGCELSKLPIQQENKSINKSTTKQNTVSGNPGIYLDKAIMHNGKPIGYVVKNSRGDTRNLKVDDVLTLLKQNKIVNARLGQENGYYVIQNADGSELSIGTTTPEQAGITIACKSTGNSSPSNANNTITNKPRVDTDEPNINLDGVNTDNDNIKDAKVRFGVKTFNGNLDAITVKDNLDKKGYRNNRDWIDNMIKMLRDSYVRESTDYNSKLNGRYINPEISVASNPDGSSPIVIMKFNIHYDQSGFGRHKDSEIAYCKMAFTQDGNKGVCSIGIPEHGYRGNMQVTKSKATADQAGIDQFWRDLTRRMHTLIVMGMDGTIPADPDELDLAKVSFRNAIDILSN